MQWVGKCRQNCKSGIQNSGGNDLVTIKLVDEENGFILLQSMGTEGKVGIYIYSEYSLFPSYIEVQILPKTV